MTFDGAFLRTRVARRVLLLFVVCAVIPTAIALGVNYFQTERRLRTDRNERLRHQSKLAAEQVLERVRLVEVELKRTIRRLEAAPLEAWVESADSTFSGLADLAIESSDSSPRPVFGDPPVLPGLTTRTREKLASGGTVVNASRDGTGFTRVVMIRSADIRGQPTLVWGSLDIGRLARETTAFSGSVDLCLMDGAKSKIFCQVEPPVDQLPNPGEMRTSAAGAHLEWSEGDQPFAGAYAIVFLAYDYAVEPWMVLAVERDILASEQLKQLRLNSILIGTIGLATVILLSSVQIRRNMLPLRSLMDATRGVMEGDLTVRAEVDSGDEFGDLAMSFNQMTRQLGRQFQTLHTLRGIDHAVLSSPDLDRIAEATLIGLPELLRCECAGLIVRTEPGSSTGTLYYYDAETADIGRADDIPVTLETQAGAFGSVYEMPKAEDLVALLGGESLLAERFVSGGRRVLVAAIESGEETTGLLFASFEATSSAPADAPDVIHQLAAQLAVAIGHVRLLDERDALSRGALRALARTIDAKSNWTSGHSERVTRLAVSLADELGLSDTDRDCLYRGGLLHDIGKLGVAESILDSPNKLTDEEWEEIREHPAIGARILAPIAAFADIIPIVLHHHECWDGEGYPARLAGTDIPWLARILAVADVFDAMTSDRPYRPAMDTAKAIAIIESESGTHFDPVVVDVLHPALESLDDHDDVEVLLDVAMGQ